MDRGLRRGWIVLVAVAAPLALIVAGCSSVDESGSESQAATSRWSLSPAARSAGTQVRIPYESAPLWNGGRSCGGSLRSGSKTLGRELLTRFSQVKSIGGYSCRRNTANGARMSVHGTGKALDVFIPVRNGRANSELGDPVANWLVANAAEIGVQLIIWNRSSWRSNGSNEKPYSGPHPHTDHLHVELTERAARMLTPWFEHRLELEGGVDDEDAGLTTTEPNIDGGDIPIAANDAGKSPDATVAAKDAAVAAPPPEPTEEIHDEHAEDDYDPELDTDGPGEEDSIGMGVRDVPDDSDTTVPPITGCAASPGAPKGAIGGSAAGLALALAVSMVRRRRRGED